MRSRCYVYIRNAYVGNTTLRRRKNWWLRAIPIFIHGDGVHVAGVGKTWGKSLHVWNWGSLLAKGSTVEIVFWIWSCFSDVFLPNKRTVNKFWKVLAWSLTQLFTGRWATHDWDNNRYAANTPEGMRAGTPLISGYADTEFPFCVLWRNKGDLDWYHKDHCSHTYLTISPHT